MLPPNKETVPRVRHMVPLQEYWLSRRDADIQSTTGTTRRSMSLTSFRHPPVTCLGQPYHASGLFTTAQGTLVSLTVFTLHTGHHA